MSVDLRLGDATLSICLDLRHPFAYLALGPAISFTAARGIAVNWLPIEVPPLRAPTAERPDDDRGVWHRRHRARALGREIETYAGAQGLVLKDPYRDPSPEAAHRAFWWMRENHPDALEPFLVALFQSYWAGGLDPSDPSQVGLLLSSGDADADAFMAWSRDEGDATMAAVADGLRERGVGGAPAYLVEDELFVGRQHLPMIEWILGGRQGPGPI